MKNKIAGFMIVIAIVLIAAGIAMPIYKKYADDKKKVASEKKLIVDDYDTFNKLYEKFTSKRNSIYINIINKLDKESIEKEYDNWIEEIDNYTNIVDNIVSSSKNLKKLCINTKYTDKNIVSNCSSFILAYETVINYYIKDIDSVNDFIDSINTENEKNYNKFTIKYEITDIDDDGNFTGMN